MGFILLILVKVLVNSFPTLVDPSRPQNHLPDAIMRIGF